MIRTAKVSQWFTARSRRILRKSVALTAWLDNHLKLLAAVWLVIILPILSLKIAASPVPLSSVQDVVQICLPYIGVVLTPIFGILIGHAAFLNLRDQPGYRFAWAGRWRAIGRAEAESHPLYGPVGLMTSLMVGMMVGVAVRTAQFVFTVPALNMHAPDWGYTLFLAMSIQLAAVNFFYMVCLIMALKAVPLFPRMLIYVWAVDVMSQVAIAHAVTDVGLPAQVAGPLAVVLTGNIKTVGLSAILWLPYLMLSDRVNVTFRHRIAAATN